MRIAASCCHSLQESVVPCAARKGPRDKAPSATVPEIVALIKKLRVHLNAAPRPAPHRLRSPSSRVRFFQLDAPTLYVAIARGSMLLDLCSNTTLLNPGRK